MSSTSISRRFNLLSAAAILASVIGMGVGHTAMAAEPGATTKQASRAEVIADLRLWLRSGLDQFTDPAMRDAAPSGYKQALAKYESLRQGPAFVEEVARASRELGEFATVSSEQTSQQGTRAQ
jgi:hypothetical protein